MMQKQANEMSFLHRMSGLTGTGSSDWKEKCSSFTLKGESRGGSGILLDVSLWRYPGHIQLGGAPRADPEEGLPNLLVLPDQ